MQRGPQPVYAALEPQSWKELREPAGFINDVVMEEANRGTGVAAALVEAAMKWLRAKDAPRVVLPQQKTAVGGAGVIVGSDSAFEMIRFARHQTPTLVVAHVPGPPFSD